MYTSVSVPCLPRSCYKKGNLKHQVRNVTRGTLIGDAIDSAQTSAARRTGLLKHSKLDEGAGLWIVPCESVHTFFMKFAIDLVYLDRERRIKKTRNAVGPWRLSVCFSAHSILELPAGTIRETQTERGDTLEIAAAEEQELNEPAS